MKFIKLDNEILNKLAIKKNIDEEVYGLKRDNQILGISIISEHTKDKNIINVYVFENYRGNGYGTIILRNSIEILKNKGYKEINFIVQRKDYIVEKLLFNIGAKHLSNNSDLAKYVVYL